MAQLVTIVYDTEDKAEQVFEKIRTLEKEYLIDVEDMAVAVKDEKGKLHVNQGDSTAAAGAVGGGFWGLLIGMLFFAPFLGAAIGALAGGAAGALADYGIDDNYIKELTASMQKGNSALFVLFHKANPEKVVPEIARYGGKVIKTSLTTKAEEQLQSALDHGAASI